jgi:hypothetical protein
VADEVAAGRVADVHDDAAGRVGPWAAS